MINLYITYNNESDFKRFLGIKNLEDYNMKVIDSGTLRGKKESYKLKNEWGSKLDPFIIIFDEQNKPIKAFYSECNSDAICQFDEYTNKKV